MANPELKIIHNPNQKVATQTHRENWEVMKPFVRFSFGALKIIGLTLLAIVKALPALKHHGKDERVVRR